MVLVGAEPEQLRLGSPGEPGWLAPGSFGSAF
jgi:hypothetical protein